MAITIAWDNEEHTIVRYDFEGEWEKLEVLERVNQVNAMMNTVEHRVDVIINMEGSRTPGGDLMRISRRILVQTPPDNMGIIALVGADAFIKALANVARKVYRRWTEGIVVVDTLDEARAFIAELRPQPEPEEQDEATT